MKKKFDRLRSPAYTHSPRSDAVETKKNDNEIAVLFEN